MERKNTDRPTRNLPQAVPLPPVPACSPFLSYSHLAILFKVKLLVKPRDNLHSWQALWAGWHWLEENGRRYNKRQSLGSLEHLPHHYPTGLLSVTSVQPWTRSENKIYPHIDKPSVLVLTERMLTAEWLLRAKEMPCRLATSESGYSLLACTSCRCSALASYTMHARNLAI